MSEQCSLGMWNQANIMCFLNTSSFQEPPSPSFLPPACSSVLFHAPPFLWQPYGTAGRLPLRTWLRLEWPTAWPVPPTTRHFWEQSPKRERFPCLSEISSQTGWERVVPFNVKAWIHKQMKCTVNVMDNTLTASSVGKINCMMSWYTTYAVQ